MTTAMEQDVLSIDGEVARIGGGGSGFYLVNAPKTAPKLKITKACTMEAVVIPYKTTCSPRVAPGKMYFFRDYYRHFDLGPAGKDSYFDCTQTFGEKCPINDALAAAGVKKRAQRMGLFNLYVLSIDGVPLNELRIADHSYANFAERLFEAANQKKKRRGQEFAGNFADPRAGSIITFDWVEDTMKTTGTKFYIGATFDFVKHDGLDGEVAKMMTQAVDLDAALNKLPYDEAKARFIDCIPVAATAPATKPAQTRTREAASSTQGTTKETQEVASVVDSGEPFDAGWE